MLVHPAASPAQPSANLETGKTSGSGNGLTESISSSGMSSQEPSIFGSVSDFDISIILSLFSGCLSISFPWGHNTVSSRPTYAYSSGLDERFDKV